MVFTLASSIVLIVLALYTLGGGLGTLHMLFRTVGMAAMQLAYLTTRLKRRECTVRVAQQAKAHDTRSEVHTCFNR